MFYEEIQSLKCMFFYPLVINKYHPSSQLVIVPTRHTLFLPPFEQSLKESTLTFTECIPFHLLLGLTLDRKTKEQEEEEQEQEQEEEVGFVPTPAVHSWVSVACS